MNTCHFKAERLPIRRNTLDKQQPFDTENKKFVHTSGHSNTVENLLLFN